MSIKPNLLLLCLLGAFLLSSCDKGEPTVINGVVTDRKTGAPVEGARVECSIAYDVTDSGHSEYAITDSNGKFHFYFPSDDYYRLRIGYVDKTNYLTLYAPPGIQQGKENNVECSIMPLDGRIKLIAENISGTTDTLYYWVAVKSLQSEFPWYGGLTGYKRAEKIPVLMGEQLIKFFNTPSEEYGYLYWSTAYFPDNSTALFMDSVYLATQDTAELVIQF